MLTLLLPLLVASPPEFNGSLGARAGFTAANQDALLSTADLPMASLLLDGNLQGKGRLLDDTLTLSLDASGFVPWQSGYADRDLDDGKLQQIDEHDVPSVRPFVVLSEAYAAWEPIGHLVLTAGKRRVVWGPGVVISPTDVLNPARDPTDPASQRAGILLGKVDVPFDDFSVSGLVSPAILEETAGIPSAAGVWPDTRLAIPEDRRDDVHWAAALRGYALIKDTDINAWVVFSNLYNGEEDADFQNHPRFMFTLSRNIFTIHEVHAEVMLEQGSTRLVANPDCVDDDVAFLTCLATGDDVLERRDLEDTRLVPRILVGWRPMLDDGTMFSLEYLYQADGHTWREHQDFRFVLDQVGQLQRDGLLPASLPTSAANSGLPNRASFNPQRRHYVLATAQKPQLFDDFTLSGTLIVGAEDLSGLASASLLWIATEWLNLSVAGFLPIPSVVTSGRGEFDGSPFAGRVLAEARAYF